jgi:hypothetical protein
MTTTREQNPFGGSPANLTEVRRKIWNDVQKWLKKKLEKPDTWRARCDQVYVRPEATTFGHNNLHSRFKLIDKLNIVLQTPTQRVAVVLGDPGTGKSTLAKKWLQEQLKKEISLDTPLPLFIGLNEALRNPKGIQYNTLLEDYLHKEVDLTDDEITLLKEKQRLIVFCDGYDEINCPEEFKNNNLYKNNEWDTWKKAQFVISSRPEKFGNKLWKSELRRELFKAFSPEGDSVGMPPSLALYQLSPFSKDDIQEYIKQWSKIGYGLHLMLTKPNPKELNVYELCLYDDNGKLHYMFKDKEENVQEGEITEGEDEDKLKKSDIDSLRGLFTRDPLPTELLYVTEANIQEEDRKAIQVLFNIALSGHTQTLLSEVNYMQELESIPGLLDLATNPIILSLILDCLPKLVEVYGKDKIETKHLKRVHVYKTFVDEWFRKQAPRVWNV